MDAIHPILNHVETFRTADLPPHVGQLTKRFILDTLGLMLAGGRAPGCRQILDQVADWGGRPEAFVAGNGRLPAPLAALSNSLMAHALDFDDTHEPADVHAFAVVLPTVLACADVAGGATGPQIMAATAIGTDIAYRMGNAIEVYRGWHPTATCGIFGAALAGGRILGLDRDGLHNAAGIAYSLASGNFQCILDGSLTKRLQPALAARGAVEAAILAKRGVTGAKEVLEGRYGFFPLYEAGEYNPAALHDRLGTRFEVEGTSMKPYPSCRFCHPVVDAVLDIAAETDIAPEDVESVTVVMPPEAYDYVGGPYRPSDSPQVSAQFSTAFNVAATILHRQLGPQEISLEAATDPDTMALADKVETLTNDDPYAFGPVTVTVRLKSGETWERRVVIAKGHPDNPLTNAECTTKLRACVAFGGWSEETADRIAEWVDGLDANTGDAAAQLGEILQGALVA
jgi:2-methylcitrate dehydratase PrpD